MTEYTPCFSYVNKNLLLFPENSAPILKLTSGKEFILDNPALDTWAIRARIKRLDVLDTDIEKAQQWLQHHNPLSIGDLQKYLTFPLKEYQTLAVKRMQLGNSALWLAMGAGKSLIALTYCLSKFLDNNQNNKFFIVCPRTIFDSWEKEIKKHLKFETNVVVAHGTNKAKAFSCLKPNVMNFILTSYETVATITPRVMAHRPCAIFWDECQKIKNRTSSRTKAAMQVTREVNVPTFLMSGTPSTNSVSGYFVLYELINPGCTDSGGNYFTFRSKFIDTKQFWIVEVPGRKDQHIPVDFAERWLERNHPVENTISYLDLGYRFAVQPKTPTELKIKRSYTIETGPKNLPELQKITEANAYVLKKDDILKDLPEKTLVKRCVELSKEQKDVYKLILETNVAELNNTKFSFSNLTSPFAKLHGIANGFLRTPGKIEFFKQQPKLDALEEYLEEAGDERVIIWSPFIPQIEQVSEFLKAKGLAFSLVYGACSNAQRKEAINSFEKGNSILLANPDVAGLGLNLAFCHLEAYLTNWFKPDVREQSEDRCHRQGQISPVTITDFVAVGTIEATILSKLNKKINIENQLMSFNSLVGAI